MIIVHYNILGLMVKEYIVLIGNIKHIMLYWAGHYHVNYLPCQHDQHSIIPLATLYCNCQYTAGHVIIICYIILLYNLTVFVYYTILLHCVHILTTLHVLAGTPVHHSLQHVMNVMYCIIQQ